MQYKKVCLVISISLVLIILSACRKKDQRYEGNYTGIERYTVLDSGETDFSIDTMYAQEFQFTYSDKTYTILQMINNPGNEISTLDPDMIIDHVYIGEAAYLKFVGDSLYFNYSNFSDYQPSSTAKQWDFRGKRN